MTIPVLHAPFDRPRLSSEACAMLEAAFAEPNEVLHRHSLADWLDDHGLPDHAACVRRTIPEQPPGYWLPIAPHPVYMTTVTAILGPASSYHQWHYDDPWWTFSPPGVLVRFAAAEVFGDKRPPVGCPINAIGTDGQRRVVLWNVRVTRLLQRRANYSSIAWPAMQADSAWMVCECAF